MSESGHAVIETDPAIIEKIAKLTDDDLLALQLVALGRSDAYISTKMYLTCRSRQVAVNTVKARLVRIRNKTGLGNRLHMALFYVDHILPHETPEGYRHGQLLAEWRAQAEQYRADLQQAGALRPIRVAAVNILLLPGHANKSDGELGRLITPPGHKIMSGDSFRHHLSDLGRQLSGRSSRVRLAVIARLAPLGKENEGWR